MKLLVFTFLTAFYSLMPSQSSDIWKTLMSVDYDARGYEYVPHFSDKIKSLDGKTITISGYMYPIEETQTHRYFMLSYYPIKICFFCGGAGPESVIEISAKQAIRLQQKKIKLRGKLKLNYHDSERLFYILINAEQI